MPKIPDLPSASSVASADLVLISQGGTTKQAAVSLFPFGSGSGTVTSVGLAVPTGLSVSGSPVTGSGTLTVSYAAGYSIPTTTKQAQWDSAYSWGNHASAGYALSSALSSYQPVDADLTAIAALAGTSGLLKKTAANTWALDTTAYLTSNQTITLSGDVSGSGTTSIAVTVADDSHNHIIANVDGLQTALDGLSSSSHNHTLDSLSNVTITANSSGEILKWNGTAWINNTLAEAGIAATSHTHSTLELGGTTDTTLSRLAAGKLGVEGKAVIKHGGAFTSGEITVSTSAPSGGSDGDIWLQI